MATFLCICPGRGPDGRRINEGPDDLAQRSCLTCGAPYTPAPAQPAPVSPQMARVLRRASCREWVEAVTLTHGVVAIRAAVDGRAEPNVNSKVADLVAHFGRGRVLEALEA